MLEAPREPLCWRTALMHKLLLDKMHDTTQDEKQTLLAHSTYSVCRTRVLDWIQHEIMRSELLEEQALFSKLIDRLTLEDHEVD